MQSLLRISLACACALAVMPAARSQAQEWPAKPVKIVVPFSPGGSSDQLARLIAPELTAAFKQQFYIENRAGSSGAVGSAQVARSEPDGYTFVNAGSGPHLTGPAINPTSATTRSRTSPMSQWRRPTASSWSQAPRSA